MGCGYVISPETMLSNNMKVTINNKKQKQQQLSKTKTGKQRRLKRFYPNLKLQDNQVFQNVKKVSGTLKQNDFQFFMIKKILKQHFLFGQLNQTEIKNIICCMDLFLGAQSEYIFQEGDIPSMFFILAKGKISIEIKNTQIKQLEECQSFGQIAIIYSTSRTASVKAVTQCKFWCLHANIIKRTLRYVTDKYYPINRQIIQKIHLFQYLQQQEKKKLALSAYRLKYSQSSKIYQYGNLPVGLFYIIRGYVKIDYQQYQKEESVSQSDQSKVEIFQYSNLSIQQDIIEQNYSHKSNKSKNKQKMVIIRKQKLFGTQAIVSDQQIKFQAHALSQTQCLVIGRLRLQEILGPAASKYQNLYHFSVIKWTLRKSAAFSQISKIILNRILIQGQIKFVKSGQFLCRERQKIQNLYISLQGTINGLGIGNLINEQILTVDYFVYSDKKLQKMGDGNVCIFELQKISSILGDHKIKIVNKIKNCKSLKAFQGLKNTNLTAIKSKHNILLKNEQIQAQNIQLKNLNVLSIFGKGQYSQCLLVKHKLTKKVYCLKIYNKKVIEKHCLQNYLINEKQVNQKINLKINENMNTASIIARPLIAKFYQTYRDQDYIYFLMQYLKGGDLLQALNEDISSCKKSYSRFFFACIILSLEYIHNINIIYRDFRPENLVFDEHGYLHLIDFSCSKIFTQKNDNKDEKQLNKNSQLIKKFMNFRTKTIIGSPYYSSPEIAVGKDYSFGTDFWSLGVLFYDIIVGQPPFGKDKSSPYQIYKQILSLQQITFTKFYKDKQGKQIILKLLQKDEIKRNSITYVDLKKHQFFQKTQWKQIQKRKFLSPYHPKLKNNTLDSYQKNINMELLTYLYGNQQKFLKSKKVWFDIKNSNKEQNLKQNWDQIFSSSLI